MIAMQNRKFGEGTDDLSLCNILSYREQSREEKNGKLMGVSKVPKMTEIVSQSVLSCKLLLHGDVILGEEESYQLVHVGENYL